jgi:hypothetical protein
VTDIPGIRRISLVVDIEAYSQRHNRAQLDLQRLLVWTLEQACTRAGIAIPRCSRQDQGDGQLLILPPGLDESRQLPLLVRGLRAALHRVNQSPGIGGRMRLRAALSQGIIHQAAAGFVGGSVVVACRLLDSAELRKALKSRQDSDLALIVAHDLFHDVFAQGYGDSSPEQYHRVDVSIPEKKFQEVGWIAVTDPPKGPLRREAEALRLPGESRGPGEVIAALGGAVAGGAAGFAGGAAVVKAAEYILDHYTDDDPDDPEHDPDPDPDDDDDDSY